MQLHENKDAFEELIERVAERTGFRPDVLEKDYYIHLFLCELAAMQEEGLPAYFKGGTALYKALKSNRRFSEDIDLSVEARDCSRTQKDKRLKKAAKSYETLPRIAGAGRTNRSEVLAEYSYDPVVEYDEKDSLQRFGKMKIEATSFTISEPVEDLEVTPLLYDHATDEQRAVLESQYDIHPVTVKTITLERVFVDKLFAAEAYVRTADVGDHAFDASKHIYDLTIMKDHPRIAALLCNPEKLAEIIGIRLEEEQNRLDGIPGVSPSEFTFFDAIAGNLTIEEAFLRMENQYVFDDADRIPFNQATSAIKDIHRRLENNSGWNKGRREVHAMKSWGKPERAQPAQPADPRADQRMASESVRAQARGAQVRNQDKKRQ